ncbi:MAG: isoprenyl transferase [Candidatus Solibacter sp.]|nr:isoprenyl transferase [Candidatus Solibacter sp.]
MQAFLESLEPGSRDYALASALDPARLPAHIGIIMDGNGRWANRRFLPRVAGHRAGVDSVRTTVETCAMAGIEVLTLYAFSIENWKRPRAEVETLWRLLHFYLGQELDRLCKNNVSLKAMGRVEALPAAVKKELQAAIDATAGNTGLTLNLAINYGGRTEIVDAVNALIEDARRAGSLASLHVGEEDIERHLYTAGQPEPDLLIRTSGEMRISNFLLWQGAYSELYITDTCWPDFSRTELLEALADYQRRHRRFGGLQPAAETSAKPARVDEAVSLPTS